MNNSDPTCEKCGNKVSNRNNRLCGKCETTKFTSAAKTLIGGLLSDVRNVVAKVKKVRIDPNQ